MFQFQLPYDQMLQTMAFCLPIFSSVSDKHSFHKIGSPEETNYSSNVKYEVGNISETDIRISGFGMSFQLKGLNNLQINRKLRDERFEYFQRHESKKIKKQCPKIKKELERKTDKNSEVRLLEDRGMNYRNKEILLKPANLGMVNTRETGWLANKPLNQEVNFVAESKPIRTETAFNLSKISSDNTFSEVIVPGESPRLLILPSFPEASGMAKFSHKKVDSQRLKSFK